MQLQLIRTETDASLDLRSYRHLLGRINSTLRDSNGGTVIERFDVISRILAAKLYLETHGQDSSSTDNGYGAIEISTARSKKEVSERFNAAWVKAARMFTPDEQPIPPIVADTDALYRIAMLLSQVSLARLPADVKGIAYEELLRNTFDKTDNQQFFTPGEIVSFMVDILRPGPADVVCDPACGTGGFLVEVLKQVGQGTRLIGLDVEERLASVCRMNLAMHGASNATVHHLSGAGTLSPPSTLQQILPFHSVDILLTNPPFGSDLNDQVALSHFRVGKDRRSRRRSVLFVERCLDLLRPGGRMAIILDDSTLNSPANSDIRALLREEALILAVISLPDVSFMPYSSAKSSVLMVQKRSAKEVQHPLFMAEATSVGRRPNGDHLYTDERAPDGSRLLLSDLPEISRASRTYQDSGELTTQLAFAVDPQHLDDRLDIAFYHPKRFDAERELANCRWPIMRLTSMISFRRETIVPDRDYGDAPIRWIGLGNIQEHSGRFEVETIPGHRIRSTAQAFRGGDILFSKLRPNLRKVVFIPRDDEGGFCSGELLVLEPHPLGTDFQISPEYLELVLRSDLVFGQLIYRITGIGRPRVSTRTVESLHIPVPPIDEQMRFVHKMRHAQAEAAKARRQAKEWRARADDLIASAYDEILSSLVKAG